MRAGCECVCVCVRGRGGCACVCGGGGAINANLVEASGWSPTADFRINLTPEYLNHGDVHTDLRCTVDREIFAVNFFCRLLWKQKIKRAKIFLCV